MPRNTLTLNYRVGRRKVTITAMDSVGPEDCYTVLLNSVLHRVATGEDLTKPIPRSVKDFMIRLNLFV